MFHPRHFVINNRIKEKNRTVKKLANKLENRTKRKKKSDNTPKKFIVYEFDHIKHKLHITDGSMFKKIKDGFRGSEFMECILFDIFLKLRNIILSLPPLSFYSLTLSIFF